MRKLATVAVINTIKPIEGADNICAYKIRNWWVVDKVNKYKVGDMDLTKDLSLNTVPIIDHSFVIGDNNIDNLIEMSDGASKLNPATNREGLVIRGHNNE